MHTRTLERGLESVGLGLVVVGLFALLLVGWAIERVTGESVFPEEEE